MPNANHVTLMGNMTREPQLKYTPSGTAVLEIGLAVNRVWYDNQNQKQEETTFVDITFWARAAENINQYVHKGDPLYVEGRLSLDQWQDKQTGQNRQKLKVVGEKFQLLGNRNGGQQGGNQQQGNGQQQGQQQPQGQGYHQPRQQQQQFQGTGGADLNLPY